MTALQAAVLGIIQGLTEFLPISSTAHLRVVPALLGWNDPGAGFTAVIQLGTLAAVVLYFRDDILRLTRAFLAALAAGRPLASADARLAWMIVAGSVPIVVCGILFKKPIETTLRSLYVISAAAVGLALLLALAEWRHTRRARAGPLKEMTQLGWGDAVTVGLWQAAALVPGSSRSGTTITGGLFRDMTRETAARFSFLLSLPSVFAAGAYQFVKARHELLASRENVLNLVIATAVSGVVGYASIAFLLGYLKRHSTFVFIVYRVALGALLLALLLGGWLAPTAGLPPDPPTP